MEIQSICRDCLCLFPTAPRCGKCGSPRVLSHSELTGLSISHIDCDAFYASVEKRDNPELVDKPLIIGGGKRGVVSTCCYIARIQGVKSAMPMFQANRLCPDAVVIPPRMKRYVEVSKQIKSMFLELTPAVEPLSLDEAFLDLTGTERLHGAPPALQLARIQKRIETEIGITVSVGLSHNKFLAKIASDLDKPRGFSIIGKAETLDFLAPKPISIIWGVGPAATRSLEKHGIRTIADLRLRDRKSLTDIFGSMGDRLWHLSQGLDYRSVSARRPEKSISNETTFFEDIFDEKTLQRYLWNLSENVSSRAKARDLAGSVISLKLRRSDHSAISRRHTITTPTSLADRIYRVAADMLHREISQGSFRLIGVGLSDLSHGTMRDSGGDLLDPRSHKRAETEIAVDQIRAQFGKTAIKYGRSMKN